MPMIDADGCLLNVSVEGRDGGPTLMLSNSLGSTMAMWEPQMKALTQIFRVIRYDRRGHGKSGVPVGPYSMERFGRDVLAILDDLNIEKAHWCGLSMGGMVGQWLGANAPDRFGKLILANTACYYPDPTNWLNRIKAVKEGGVAGVADTVIAAWLTADFREREPHITQNLKAMMIATPPAGYIACCEALSTLDQRDFLPRIKSPTLGGRGRVHSQSHSRRVDDDPGCGPHFQRRATARLHGRGGRLPDAEVVSFVIPGRPEEANYGTPLRTRESRDSGSGPEPVIGRAFARPVGTIPE
jgi:3-oxoadipate enol-lactonase